MAENNQLMGQNKPEEVKQALDQLFVLAKKYRTSGEYYQLIRFVSSFRFYSPFNAMLIHTQLPGATFVASASRWVYHYKRRIKPASRPLVILQPMGPVMFVFDVSDTESGPESVELPLQVDRPFDVREGNIGNEFFDLLENAKRDGVRIEFSKAGAQSAGSIRSIESNGYKPQKIFNGKSPDKKDIYIDVNVHYLISVNETHKKEAQFVTVLHELAHLYCGHVGTPDKKWWPDRHWLENSIKELEAESIAYIVCSRFGIDNPSEKYLSGYVKEHDNMPELSMERVMKAAGLLEEMCRTRMKARK